MLPKDLLEHLETGDRTAEHLKDKPAPEVNADLNDMVDSIRYVTYNPLEATMWGAHPWGLQQQQNAYHQAAQLGQQQAQSAFGNLGQYGGTTTNTARLRGITAD